MKRAIEDLKWIKRIEDIGTVTLRATKDAEAKIRRAAELRREAARLDAEAAKNVAAIVAYVEKYHSKSAITRAKGTKR